MFLFVIIIKFILIKAIFKTKVRKNAQKHAKFFVKTIDKDMGK